MQRKRDGLVPIEEVFSGLDGPLKKALRWASFGCGVAARLLASDDDLPCTAWYAVQSSCRADQSSSRQGPPF